MSIVDQLELPSDIDLPSTVRAALDMRLLWIAKRLSDIPATSSGVVGSLTLVGTRAQRGVTGAQGQAAGTQWVESDTGLTYVVRSVTAGGAALAWWYLAGTWRGNYSGKPSALTKFDQNLQYHIADKNRTLRWTGTGWTFADHEVIPPLYISGFDTSPGTGWHICDGSTVAVLNSDGTTTNTALKDFTTARYPKWGPTAAGAGAAVAPLITGDTGAGTAHSHGPGTLSTGANTGPSVNVTSSGAVAVAPDGHSHIVTTGATATESTHTHPHGTLVNDALGEPLHYGLVAFQRI